MKHRRRRSRRKPHPILGDDTFWMGVVGAALAVIGICGATEALNALNSVTPDVTSVQDKVNQRCGTNISLVDLATRGEELLALCK